MLMWIALGVAALFLTPVVVGYLLPVGYDGESTVEFDCGVQEVWDAFQDVRAHPMTGKMMKSIDLQEPVEGRPAWTEDMGRGEVIRVTTIAFEPPRHMTREMSSATANMRSRWEYTLEPAGEGCRVTLVGHTDIERGTWHTPIFRFMMVVGGGVKKGLDIQLDMVAASLGGNSRRLQ